MQPERVPAGAEERKDSTVTAALEDILSTCGRLESSADEILWRVQGNHGSPPTEEKSPSPQPVEHRFVQSVTEILRRLNLLDGRLGEAVREFDRTFGV